MAVRRDPDRAARPGAASEVSWDDLRPTVELATRREPWATDERVVRQLVDRMATWRRATEVHHFGAPAPGRSPTAFAAYCHLYLDRERGTGQVEEVETLEEHRSRGHGRAVVLAAVDAARSAGADLVWLYADDDDWPKEWYRRLGFDDIGRTATWTLWAEP